MKKIHNSNQHQNSMCYVTGTQMLTFCCIISLTGGTKVADFNRSEKFVFMPPKNTRLSTTLYGCGKVWNIF